MKKGGKETLLLYQSCHMVVFHTSEMASGTAYLKVAKVLLSELHLLLNPLELFVIKHATKAVIGLP